MDNRITEQQLELLKSLQYVTDEKEMNAVKELLSLYYERKSDAAIDKVEAERNYTAEVYESWLNKERGNDVGKLKAASVFKIVTLDRPLFLRFISRQ